MTTNNDNIYFIKTQNCIVVLDFTQIEIIEISGQSGYTIHYKKVDCEKMFIITFLSTNDRQKFFECFENFCKKKYNYLV